MGKDLHGAYSLGVSIGLATVFASSQSNNAYPQICNGQRLGKRLYHLGILSPESFKELDRIKNPHDSPGLQEWFGKNTGMLAEGIADGKFRDLYYLGYYLGRAEARALQGNKTADLDKKEDLANARQFADKLRGNCCPNLKREDLSEYLNHDQIKFIRTGWAYYLEWQIP